MMIKIRIRTKTGTTTIHRNCIVMNADAVTFLKFWKKNCRENRVYGNVRVVA